MGNQAGLLRTLALRLALSQPPFPCGYFGYKSLEAQKQVGTPRTTPFSDIRCLQDNFLIGWTET